MAPQRLIPLERRRAALATAGIAALVVVVLALLVAGQRLAGIDNSITDWIHAHLRIPNVTMANAVVSVSAPTLVVGVLGTLAVGALLRRAWNVAASAVLGPTAAVVVTDLALKPLVGHEFPSGHETGVVALVTVLAILTLRMGWHVAVELAIMTVLGLWALVAAVGLAYFMLHHPSATVGGAGVAIALVLPTAVAIDAVTHRRRATADTQDRSTPPRVADPDRPT